MRLKRPDQSNPQQRTIEQAASGEELKQNDLIVSDFEVSQAQNVLNNHDIPFRVMKYTKRQVLDTQADTAVPGEFVLHILDPQNPDQPAPFDVVKQVFQLIKGVDIAVRYGKNPEKEG